jgi:outer membrane receptor protein involved in Fe transport
LAQVTDAAIVGTVTDSQGGLLQGVNVTARNTETGLTRTTVSAADGKYRLANLPTGPYDLKAELLGFSIAEVKGAALTVSLELNQNFSLSPGGVQQSVTVTAEAPAIESSSSEVASAVIAQQQIDSLPIPGRQPSQLSLLLPGTGTDSTRTKRPSVSIGVGSINLSGTNFLVDGVMNLISRGGDTRDIIPQTAVQEFRVITSQTPAEYGGRSGGVISLVTKSGTNLFHGEVFEYFRNKVLQRPDVYTDAQDKVLGKPDPNYERNQYGGAFGGPIIKDRLHFYLSWERSDEKQYLTVNTGQPQFYSALEGTVRGGLLLNSYFLRGDYTINDKQNLFSRAFKQDSTYFCDGCGGTVTGFGAGNSVVPGWTYATGHTWIISPTIINQLTLMIAQSWNDSRTTAEAPPQYAGIGSVVYKFPSMTWGYAPGMGFHSFYQQVREAVSFHVSKHNIKAGFDTLNVPVNLTPAQIPATTWTFSTDQYFNPYDPNFSFANLKGATQYASTYPYRYSNASTTYSAYVQDEWKLLSNLTVNLGARYDLQTKIWNENLSQSDYSRPLPLVNFAARGDHNNIAPRVGFAWDVFGAGRTVVRGGYGIVYANIQNGWFDSELTDLQRIVINIKNPSYPNPFGSLSPSAFSSATPNIGITANNMVNPAVQSASLGISQALGGNLILSVDALATHVTKYPVSAAINTPLPGTTTVKPFSTWGTITEVEPIGTYNYHAVLVRLERRFAKRYQYVVSYTLANQKDTWDGGNTAAGVGSIVDYYNQSTSAGPSAADRRHNLVASGSVNLRWGFVLGAIWTVRSSLPFDALAGKDLNSDGSNTDYVPGTSADQGNRDLNLGLVNAWRAKNGLGPIAASQIASSRLNQLDVRLSKSFALGERFRLTAIGQVFNVLGTNNLGGVGSTQVTNALSNSFGEILTALPRQQAELALRLTF